MDSHTSIPATATLVVHRSGATVFGAVGEPVPASAQMGIAEQHARMALPRWTPDTGRSPIPVATLRWLPASPR